TNLGFLKRVLDHPEFVAGRTHTHFIEEHLAEPPAFDPAESVPGAIAATLAGFFERRGEQRVLPALEPAFRNNRFGPEWIEYKSHDRSLRVEYTPRSADGFEFSVDGTAVSVRRAQRIGLLIVFE